MHNKVSITSQGYFNVCRRCLCHRRFYSSVSAVAKAVVSVIFVVSAVAIDGVLVLLSLVLSLHPSCCLYP